MYIWRQKLYHQGVHYSPSSIYYYLLLPKWRSWWCFCHTAKDCNNPFWNLICLNNITTFPFHFLFFLSMRVTGCCHFFFPLMGCGAYWDQIQFTRWAKARVRPGWVASSSQDPYWWQWLPHKVPTAHQEQVWGSVSCSRILRHVAQSRSRGAGILTSDLNYLIKLID